jgi:hypothetical protein
MVYIHTGSRMRHGRVVMTNMRTAVRVGMGMSLSMARHLLLAGPTRHAYYCGEPLEGQRKYQEPQYERF